MPPTQASGARKWLFVGSGSAQLGEVLDGTNHLAGVAVFVRCPPSEATVGDLVAVQGFRLYRVVVSSGKTDCGFPRLFPLVYFVPY